MPWEHCSFSEELLNKLLRQHSRFRVLKSILFENDIKLLQIHQLCLSIISHDLKPLIAILVIKV